MNTRKYGYNKGLFLYPRVRRQSSEGWAPSELIRTKCPPNSSLPNLSTACNYASKSFQTWRHRRTILEQRGSHNGFLSSDVSVETMPRILSSSVQILCFDWNLLSL
ncbi:hypothetical protein IscW_ISCW012523 [Ixodes scapularis]|uniref:Uncharacterized protein n=1 Tax=Ixodes scapularis TaxID=6945 RepID=B7QC13_IXOSC|nr:hypothetical protein IscW_ISCW012523 [Ixodes scapularis]|eukprot:XP_002413077.1 hypothetical protein IscW_ISCW012523 [Ixodes scapularis]